MNSRPIPATSVLLSGVLCIIFGGVVILAALLVGLAIAAPAPQSTVITPHVRLAMRIIMLALLAIGGFEISMGLGIMSLKNWARKAMVLCSGTAVVVSVLCLYASLAMLAAPRSPQLTPRAAHIAWGSFLGISLFVFAIGIWWVVLFTRVSVVASFTGTVASAAEAPSLPATCPLPLGLFAGYYIAVAAITVFALPVRQTIPDMLFGRAIFGSAHNLYSLAMGGLCLASAIGLFRLKAWSLPLALGIEAFSSVRRFVTIFDPRSPEIMRNALGVMAAHGYKAPAGDPTLHFRYLEALGLGFSLAMLAILWLSRSAFQQAASAAAPAH